MVENRKDWGNSNNHLPFLAYVHRYTARFAGFWVISLNCYRSGLLHAGSQLFCFFKSPFMISRSVVRV